MLTAIVDGNTFPLDDGTYSYYLGEDGTGMMPIHRLSSRGPLQHGDSDRGYRGDPRFIRLLLAVNGSSRNDAYAKRQKLLSIFRPTTNTPVILRWELNSVFQIDAYYVGEMSMPSGDRDGFYQKVVVELKSPDPAFYFPNSNAVTFQLGGGGDLFTVPMTVPMRVGSSTIDQTTSIIYTGTFESNPTLIRITGPIANPVITNETTSEKLDFTGTTISAGNYLDIDCRYGRKTVVNSSGVSQIGTLTEDSDLATFHIEPASDGSGVKANSIRVKGTGVTASTAVSISYRIRFVGI